MSYDCKILADSADGRGNRLVTYEIEFPRLVLAEFNTHCMLARNSASSRAIPVARQLRRVMDDPFVPERFGINQPGMQSARFLEGVKDAEARTIWITGRDRAILTALELLVGLAKMPNFYGAMPSFDDPDVRVEVFELLDELKAATDADEADPYLNVHKQLANRVLEPYMWHRVIATGTEWSNFFALRNHKDAQPEIHTIAAMMEAAYDDHDSQWLPPGEWHLPLLQGDEAELARTDPERWARICAARCARVSYLTHDGVRDLAADEQMYEKLTSSGHMSPLEHIGFAMSDDEYATNEWSAKFHGFVQFRKLIPNEDDFAKVRALASA